MEQHEKIIDSLLKYFKVEELLEKDEDLQKMTKKEEREIIQFYVEEFQYKYDENMKIEYFTYGYIFYQSRIKSPYYPQHVLHVQETVKERYCVETTRRTDITRKNERFYLDLGYLIYETEEDYHIVENRLGKCFQVHVSISNDDD